MGTRPARGEDRARRGADGAGGNSGEAVDAGCSPMSVRSAKPAAVFAANVARVRKSEGLTMEQAA